MPSAGMRLRLSAIDTLKTAQQSARTGAAAGGAYPGLPDFFVLMVESRTWGFFHPTSSGFDPNCRPAAPNVSAADAAERDAVLVGSELSDASDCQRAPADRESAGGAAHCAGRGHITSRPVFGRLEQSLS